MYNERKTELGKIAADMRRMSYIPYSHYAVGAALLTKAAKFIPAATSKTRPILCRFARNGPPFSKLFPKEKRTLQLSPSRRKTGWDIPAVPAVRLCLSSQAIWIFCLRMLRETSLWKPVFPSCCPALLHRINCSAADPWNVQFISGRSSSGMSIMMKRTALSLF